MYQYFSSFTFRSQHLPFHIWYCIKPCCSVTFHTRNSVFRVFVRQIGIQSVYTLSTSDLNPLNPELNPICYFLALLAHHFLHVSRIRVKLLTFRLLMSYIYIYDISRLRVNIEPESENLREDTIL